MANSVDPNQTVPFGSSLIWVYTVCSDAFAPILMVKRFSGSITRQSCTNKAFRQLLAVVSK